MTISRWRCEDCKCINDKRPAFNVYLPGRKNASGPDHIRQEGAAWLCTNSDCKHPANKHHFTFEKPKE